MKTTKLKVISAEHGGKQEGELFQEAVNTFCKGRDIISMSFEFNPSISVRHLAYITYSDNN